MQQSNKFRRLAIDRRRARWREGTGIVAYRDALAQALATLDATIEPIGDGGDAAARGTLRDLPRALRGHVSGMRQGDGWQVPDLYRLARRHFSLTGTSLELRLPDPPPIVHWSHALPLRLAGAANVYTVHDLIALETPQLTGIDRRRHARLLERVMAGAAHLVTVSETVRESLIALGAAPGRVTSCYQSVETAAPGSLPPGLAPGGYFLALGRVESRKNIERLMLAHRTSASPLPLVICGPEGHWQSRAEARRAAALMQGAGIVRLGWQSDSTVAALIAGARALLMPSLAEGFGRPMVEAMRLGVPALASAGGAMAEVAGGAALLVDPHDTDAITGGIRRLERDESLHATLIEMGHARARNFSIESFAQRLGDLYQRIAMVSE